MHQEAHMSIKTNNIISNLNQDIGEEASKLVEIGKNSTQN